MSVNSFHNFCIPIKNMSQKFSVIALDQDNNVEIFKHKKKIYMDSCGILKETEIIKNLI